MFSMAAPTPSAAGVSPSPSSMGRMVGKKDNKTWTGHTANTPMTEAEEELKSLVLKLSAQVVHLTSLVEAAQPQQDQELESE